MITAKVVCSNRTEAGQGDDLAVTLTFGPDYAEGRNAEWAVATPALALTMTVKGPVAERFHVGDAYTLTFTPDDEDTSTGRHGAKA